MTHLPFQTARNFSQNSNHDQIHDGDHEPNIKRSECSCDDDFPGLGQLDQADYRQDRRILSVITSWLIKVGIMTLIAWGMMIFIMALRYGRPSERAPPVVQGQWIGYRPG